MKMSDAYSSSYLSVDRWPTEETEGEIVECGIDDNQFSKSEDARIVYVVLKGSDERLRVNKTNAVQLATSLGDELQGWIGATISYHRVQATIRGRKGWQGMMELVSAPKPKPKKKP